MINTGTYDMDTTGSYLRDAFNTVNAYFAQLFAAIPGIPQVINTGSFRNDGSGDNMPTAFGKVNANFTYLFSLAAYSVGPYLVNTTSIGNIDGVVGYPADPGKLAWLKVKANFYILWGGTTQPPGNIGSFIFGQSAFGWDAF